MRKNLNNSKPNFVRSRMTPLAKIVTAILIVFFTASVTHAQSNGPGFHVSATGDLNCQGGQTLSQATAPALIGPLTIPCTSGQGIAAAEAGASSLRAKGRSEHSCCGTASGGNGSARIQIENVIISGPAAASIPISLNFRLRGTFAGNTDFGQNNLFLFIGLSGFNTNLSTFSQIDLNHNGVFNKTGIFAPIPVGFPTGSIDQTFVTPVSNAAPNQPLRLEIQLQAGTAMAGLGSTETDFFTNGNGLYLPFGTPVFNLPPGYTINIPEMNIVNNFVQLPAVVSGDIFIVGTNASEISLAGVTQVTGSIGIDGNTAATVIDLGSVQSVGGSISIDNNTAAGSIDLSAVQSVGGSISVDNDTAAGSIDLSSLQTVGTSISIGNNTAAGSIDLGALATANGDVTIANNGPCTHVIVGPLAHIIGNLTLESCGTGTFSIGSVVVGGSTSLNTTGYTTVNGTTANGMTILRNKTGEAAMTLQLPVGTFTTPVSFSLTHLDPATLTPELGVGANNAAATIDPVGAYLITFAVPTLNQNASLSFDVFLSGLDTATANALLTALGNGSATLATRGDAAGSQYQAFPICGSGQPPSVGGCVQVQLLDANGQPTTGTPSIVRFSNVVGHFSTWAVAIVTPQQSTSHLFNGLLSPYPTPPYTTTPAFNLGRVVPLKFNWVNAAGTIVDSANANPTVSISSSNCTTQAPLTEPIAAEDAGNSGGLRYDATTSTWTFNWNTKPLSAGCFIVRVTSGNASYAAPSSVFPIALRDR